LFGSWVNSSGLNSSNVYQAIPSENSSSW
jgi:hypothetical protein